MYEEIKSKKFCVPLALILNNFHNVLHDVFLYYTDIDIYIIYSLSSVHKALSLSAQWWMEWRRWVPLVSVVCYETYLHFPLGAAPCPAALLGARRRHSCWPCPV